MTSDQSQEPALEPVFKVAEADEGQGAGGAQTRSVHEVHEDASTGATQPLAASVECEDRFLFSLEGADLSNLLMPSWVKEDAPKTSAHQYQEKEGSRSSQRFESDSSRGKFAQRGDRRDGRSGGPKERRGKPADRSSSSRNETRPQRQPEPVIQGWGVYFFPEQRGIDEIAKQIKAEAKAYPIFELARLILAKPERYRVKLERLSSSRAPSSKLYQCLLDETLWLSEKELLAHAFKQHRDRYYHSERTTVEPPKGSYSCVGVCGMSQTLLGPPNHHEYQAKVRQLHAERFSHVPLELFKSRIQTVRDEALMEQWKEAQSVQEVFTPLEAQDGSALEKFTTLSEVEAHFKKQHAAAVIAEVGDEVTLSSVEGLRLSAPVLKNFVQQGLEELKRFPLPLSHLLGQEFTNRGLQIFKAHENIIYVSIARPRALNRSETPVADNLVALLDTLEVHGKSSRVEQWKALVASRPVLEGGTEEERESAVAKDLSWLIHEGYVVNYALRGFAVGRKS